MKRQTKQSHREAEAHRERERNTERNGRREKHEEVHGFRRRRSTAWLTNRGSLQSRADEKERRGEEKGRGVREKEGNLMWAVNHTTFQPPPPCLFLHPPQQEIYACALSIPPISYEGSAAGEADKWTASEAPGQPCVVLVVSLCDSAQQIAIKLIFK